MATLETDEANLIDAEDFNWRLVVYPLLIALVVIVGGLGYYYYQLDQREQLEATARTALLQAKTPEEWVKVADQYPTTTQAALALINAATTEFGKKNYVAAIADYQKIVQNTATDSQIRNSAQLGAAAASETNNKADDAISAYLEVGHLGAKSPFAPFALYSAARLYEEKGDKENQRRILSEAASLDPDSPFVKQAQMKLNEIAPKPAASASAPATIIPAQGTAATPVPVAPTPAPATAK